MPKPLRGAKSFGSLSRCVRYQRDGHRCPHTVMSVIHDVCSVHRFGADYATMDMSMHSRLRAGAGGARIAGHISTLASQTWPDAEFAFKQVNPTPSQEAVLVEWVNGPTLQTVSRAVAGLFEDWVPQYAADGSIVFPSVLLSRLYPAWMWVAVLDETHGEHLSPPAEQKRSTWLNGIVASTRQVMDGTESPDLYWDPLEDHVLLVDAPGVPTSDVRWLRRNIDRRDDLVAA